MAVPHVEYLYSLNRYEIKPGLERMNALMKALRHPEKKFKSIHISGTNGKGSVAAMVESVLRTSGLKTGLYTSPDIYSFNERIQVAGEPISDEKLGEIVWRLREIADREEIPATFFEIGTAAAYIYFAEQEVDVAVIEVGMGGLLDATNVITPVVSVITNIGLDHQEFLGDTKEKIATEKAGIIKPGIPFVTGENDPTILKILLDTATKNNAPTVEARKDNEIEVVDNSWEGQNVKVSGSWKGELSLPLLGEHQVENLKVALATLTALQSTFKKLSFEKIQNGIAATRWAGRLDVISKNPLILVDGAHNADGVGALITFMQNVPRKEVLVLGVKRGRDMTAFLPLASMFQHVIVTKGNFMPEDPSIIAAALDGHPSISMCSDVPRALRLAVQKAGTGTTLIAGSLYLVADALAVLRRRTV
ncbi:MAG: bifunctional folylpolyglutamate synthase/dihydrofolate synthase [Candidatus Andersenbacteria bacterium]|nr:bifunctional folylpolyglutamate synthase/dihydrofolate synthase [Candidatus Andersenbacteria bacterium]MBI3250933.1 bifunctional folylpolyglutamate synthase/dihydrofolate synthase [Candidatus Andersenbacteria bacterium]